MTKNPDDYRVTVEVTQAKSDAAIEGFPLVPQQRRLWRLKQSGRLFLTQMVLAIEGPLEANRIANALGMLVQRHEILRTCFMKVAGMSVPLQVIQDAAPVALRVVDATEQSEHSIVERLLRENNSEVFDYTQTPLLRASLVISSPERQTLILALPSLCADTQSLSNLLNELAALCETSTTGVVEHPRNPRPRS